MEQVKQAADAPADLDTKAARPWWRRRATLLTIGIFLVLAWLGDLLAVGFMVVVGLLFFMGGFQSFGRARVIADTPTATIRGAAQGRVELNVRVPLDTPLIAPLSGEECCFWTLTVERKVGSRRHSGGWQTVATAHSVDGGWLETTDGTGTCLIAIPDADITSRAKAEHRIIGSGLDDLGKHFPAGVRQTLHASGEKRVIEQRFPVDATLHAIGLFKSLPSNTTPFDDDWTHQVLRQGAAAPAWARKLAEATQAASADERERLKEDWRARMRKLEGIPPGAPLGGTVTVHTLVQDMRRNQMFPLLLSDSAESSVIKQLRRGGLVAKALGALVIASAIGILALSRPDLFNALVGLFK